MSRRKVGLTRQQDAFVEKMIKSGEYQNASEVFRDAMRALQQRRKEDALNLKELRAQIKAGATAVECGESTSR